MGSVQILAAFRWTPEAKRPRVPDLLDSLG